MKIHNFFSLILSHRSGKKAFILFSFCLLSCIKIGAEGIFNYAEYKFASAISLPTQESGKESSLSADTGLKLSFKNAQFRSYASLPKSQTSTLSSPYALWEKTSLPQELRFGADLSLFKELLPLSLKAGRNSFSKSLSKIKNPAPSSTANPLSKSFSFNPGLGAALPSLTSAFQPLSLALEVQSPSWSLPLTLSLESFINDKKEGAVNFSLRHDFSRSSFLQSAFTASRMYIEYNSSILEKNNVSFSPDYFYALMGELALHCPLAKVHFYSGLHQSPYEENFLWFRLDGRTSLGALLINLSYYAIPTCSKSPKAVPFISSSGICRTIEESCINPQYVILFSDKNASSLKFGFSALNQWKVTATNTPVHLNLEKFRAGLSFDNRFLSFTALWTRPNILLSGEAPTKSSAPEPYQALSLSSTFASRFCKFSLAASYSNYPPQSENSALKEIYSASLTSAIFSQSLIIKNGIDMTFKDKERYSSSLENSVSWKLTTKYLRTFFKVTLIIPF